MANIPIRRIHNSHLPARDFLREVWQAHSMAQEETPDFAFVEANRRKYGVYFNRKGADEFPEWLVADYRQTVVDAQDLVDDAMAAEPDEEWISGLMKRRPALRGDAELAWSRWQSE